MALLSTLRRSVQLGLLGVDAVRARRQPGGPDRRAAQRLMASRMAAMRGLPHKIGQILSLAEMGGEDPSFADLAHGTAAVPARDAFTWIARELGRPIETVFRSLAEDGSAASLAQVHSGVLRDGRPVAVKIQYPDAHDALEADLAFLGVLGSSLSPQRSGFDPRSYRAEMRRNLLEELDYTREVATLGRFAHRCTEIEGLTTPVPVTSLCTPRLIVMSWVDGQRIDDARAWPLQCRRDAARILLRQFLRGCFVWREMHADPHAGNLRFSRRGDDVEVGMLDFGCVKTLTPLESDALWRLAEDGHAMSGSELLTAYLDLGFNRALIEPIAGRLADATRVLFEPFHVDRPFDPRQWRLSERLADALGDDRWNFRFAGPATLIFLIRAFQGLVTYVNALDAQLSWREELLAVQRSTQRRCVAVPATAPAPLPSDADSNMQATALHIQVLRAGEQTVRLTFAATAAERLSDLVPFELQDALHARGIDLARVAARAVESGYQPMDLFALDEGEKSVRVWLA